LYSVSLTDCTFFDNAAYVLDHRHWFACNF